jgi:hypothetical protein
VPITIATSVEMFGYGRFFVWVLISAVPAVVLSRLIPIRGGARR